MEGKNGDLDDVCTGDSAVVSLARFNFFPPRFFPSLCYESFISVLFLFFFLAVCSPLQVVARAREIFHTTPSSPDTAGERKEPAIGLGSNRPNVIANEC